jgi:YD repeat-containing protein
MLYLQYRSNHLYMYPEHRDHDPAGNDKDPGHGDVFHANVPYYLMSQGSSGSDRAFLNAAATTLAAFRPEVKARLAKAGLLMPTVQMILRKSQKTLVQESDYFTGKAHPTVFDSKQLDVVKMVTLAQAITPEALPPLARVKVEREELGALGRDYFDVAAREKLFDTPCAIARMVKSVRRDTRMVLSGRDSLDADQKPLTYRWVVLRGDTQRITIKPLEADGSRVELTTPWHEPRPVAPGEALESSRVDVALFVSNGAHDSPPAFISLSFPADQKRTYDAEGRVLSVDYADPVVSRRYVDPTLDFKKDWRDDYHYDAQGRPTGWTRTRGEAKSYFTADGLRILERDPQGQPTKTQPVRYTAQPGRDGVGKLVEQDAPAI